jgi:hypothetical protein
MAKKQFRVNIVRTSYGFHTITVEAENAKKAKELALEEAGDHEYPEKDADYEVNDVTEIKTNQKKA